LVRLTIIKITQQIIDLTLPQTEFLLLRMSHLILIDEITGNKIQKLRG